MDVVPVNISKVVLLAKFSYVVVFYINFWRHHHELPLRRYNESISMKICLCVWRSGTCQPSIEHQRVGSFISYCYAFIYQSLCCCCCCMQCQPKSCSRSYVYFCVPWILDAFSNDPCARTTSDFDCCLHWLSIHVGKCSIARPWFSWGLVGGKTSPSHL